MSGDGSGRTAVLLGAGASADAGLLLTSELAAAIVRKANEVADGRYQPTKPDWVRALNAVYAGMVGHKGARGDDPLSAVNIETLVSAVRLLRHRDDHEVSPFVASWSAPLSNFSSSTLPVHSGKAIADGVSKANSGRANFGDRDITNAVAEIARAAISPDLERPFAVAESFILSTLVELLGAHRDVSYFEPLLALARAQAGGVDVITLNYDLTVEAAAAHSGVTVNRGITSWRPGDMLDFPLADGVINLMKLHGSLDWRASQPGHGASSVITPRTIEVIAPGPVRDGYEQDAPWIVVGDREKLATDGPTLALNFAARTALLRSTHLAIIGYSFGDAHINAMIRDWIAADRVRTVTVLDIQWPRERYFTENMDFRTALIAAYGRTQGAVPANVPRALPIEGGASEYLGSALTLRPTGPPDPIAAIDGITVSDAIRFEITWHGPELADILVTASLPPDAAGRLGIAPQVLIYDAPPPATPQNWAQQLRIAKWKTESALVFYLPASAALPVQVHIDAASIVGSQRWTGLVVAPSQDNEPNPDK